MKRYVLALSVILMVLGLAIAQEKAAEQQPAAQAEPKVQSGEVVSIDATKNEIVIKDSAGTEVKLLISASTKITRAGKTIALGDVKVGDKVSSDCETSADGCKAKAITVTPPAPGN